MSIQKIMSIAQQKKSLNRNNKISFKGFTKEISSYNGSVGHEYVGTSGHMVKVEPRYASVTRYDIKLPYMTYITNGKGGYKNRDYEKATVDVYFADPNEEITDAIIEKHAFIVQHVKMPNAISPKVIEKSNSMSEVKGFVDDLERRDEILILKSEAKSEELNRARSIMNRLSEEYEEAKAEFLKLSEEKAALEAQISDNTEVLILATKKLQQFKADKENEYKIAQARKSLEDMQRQLENIDGGEGLSQLRNKIQEYLNDGKKDS